VARVIARPARRSVRPGVDHEGPGRNVLSPHISSRAASSRSTLLVGCLPVAERVEVLDPACLPLRCELADLDRRPEVSDVETHHQLIATNDAPEAHRPRLQGLRVIADFSAELRLPPQAFLDVVGELGLEANRDALAVSGS